MDLNSAIERWCDIYLGIPFGYEDDKPSYISDKLIYRDYTSCSASYSFQNVYLSDDNTYIVYSECSRARCTGGNYETSHVEYQNFETLAEVLDYIMLLGFHDPNSTGELLLNIIYNYQLELDDEVTYEYGEEWRKCRIPILSKCGNDVKLINAINKYPLHMDG
uniref:Uncharacterized protein n=1 Tax=Pithovirus LCPAC406 TaxID=2506599 RepID=A0A481ZGD7_9VIRU|nr:MAG: hypothetical protein LCPAC406_01430 [Pithovirus LCPAC406]